MNLRQLRQQIPELENLTDDEIVNALAAAKGIDTSSPGFKRMADEFKGYNRSGWQAVGDTGLGLLQGVVGIGEMGATLGGALIPGVRAFDNPVVNSLGAAREWLGQQRSEGIQAQEEDAQRAAAIAEQEAAARGEGFWGQTAAGFGSRLGSYARNPGMIVQDIATNAPQLAVGGLVGRGAYTAARGLGLAARGATRAGVAGGVASSAALQGADVAGDTYDRAVEALGDTIVVTPEGSYTRPTNPDEVYDRAASLAGEAGLKAGAASLGLSMLPGGSMIERSFIPGARRAIANRGLVRGGAARGGAALVEGGTEAGEEGYGAFAGNQAIAEIDPNTNLATGVGPAAAQGFVAGTGTATIVSGRRPQPRTPTGEIDLTGRSGSEPPPDAGAPTGEPTYPEGPTYQRRGLDPLNERSSPWSPPGPPLQLPYNPTVYADSTGVAQVGSLPSEQEVAERRYAPQPADPAPASAAPAVPLLPYSPTIYTDPSGTSQVGAMPTEQEVAERKYAPQPATGEPGRPNRGQVLAALQAANRDLSKNVVRKDGQVAGGRGNAPIRNVLEAADPLAAMRDLYQDGAAPRDELLDTWHEKLTGQTIAQWKAEQAPNETAPADANSAGFVPETEDNIYAQIEAVKQGRKPAIVLGQEEAQRVGKVAGLARAVATDPNTGATAVVMAPDRATVQRAVARTQEVGLKQAMGETLGVANPTLTSTVPDAPVAAVQQRDNETGAVLAEEIVTPADLPNVRPIPGATAQVVPVDQPVQERRAAARQPAPKAPKAPRYGKKTSDELVEIANSTKEQTELDAAELELYKRWVENGDEQAEAHFLEGVKGGAAAFGSTPRAKELASMLDRQREAKGAKKGQDLGKKFDATFRTGTGGRRGVSLPDARNIVELTTRAWKNVPNVHVVASSADLPQHIQDQMSRDGVTDPRAAYSRGEVWVVAGNHASAADVVTSLLHEIAGHHGLRGLLGSAFKPTMRQIYDGNATVRRAADAKMQADGLPLETAVEEVLADMAETGNVAPTALQRLTNAIRQFLARAGLARFMKNVTDGEVRALLTAAREFVENGAGATPESDSDAQFRRAANSPYIKPFSDAAERVVARVNAEIKGKEISPKLLAAMTLRQIDEQFGKYLPAMRDWIGAITERGAKASRLAAKADRVALQWEQSVKDPAERKALADVLLRASVAEISLDNTSPEYLNSLTDEQRAEHAALRQKLAGLSEEARRTRSQALEILREQWDYTRQALEKFITNTVSDPALRAQRLADLRQEMGRNRGDYFPLSRFGDRIVIGRGAASDGRDVVSFHESAASAEAEVRRLKAAGVKKIDVTLRTERDPRQRASTGFMNDLHALIDNSEADPSVKDSMHEALQQLYLKSLPELSGAKHMIRREAVEGYSQDALRVFADAVTRGSRYAARLDYAPEVQAAMEAAEIQSRSSDKRTAAVVIGQKDGQAPVVRVVAAGTDRLRAVQQLNEDGYTTTFFNTQPETARERLAGAIEGATDAQLDGWVKSIEQVVGRSADGVEDTRAAKALYNHMIGLQRTEGNEESSALVQALGQLGYTWYLGFSPAFWLLNTLQNPMVGIPHLGAKYGVAKASAEWTNAMKWFGGVRMGKLLRDKTPFSVEWLREQVRKGNIQGITKQELDMLQTLEDRQILDFTQAMDLSRIGQASSSARYKFLRLAAAGAHHTEVFNRVTFALAAYRLALKSNGNITHEEAVRRAENDVAAVHFDYSYGNKPAMMRGKQTRLLFMFQQYRQHMLYWWANTVKDAIKGESKEDRLRARKAAVLMAATQGVFAGALGMPFAGVIGLLASLLADDEDEPFDFERWVMDAATDITGSPEAGQVLAKGVFAAAGMNISQRIGQGDLIPFTGNSSARFERNADDKFRAIVFDLLGPLGSIGLNVAKSTEAFARGDTLSGLALITPKAASDIIKAYQLEIEGLKNARGQFLATAEAFDGADKFLQAAGVTPTAVANIRADRGRVLDAEQKIIQRTRRLTDAFIEAWMRGDREGIGEAVAGIKAYNQKMLQGKAADRSMLITGRRLEAAIRDRYQRQLILALTGGTAETRRQLILAASLSGLANPVTPQRMQENLEMGLPGLPRLPGLPN